jgi:Ti-type conjugative transfer relaxase TraA
MAIYYFNAKIISKGSGASAVASAAYRHATKMTADRSGVVRDYSYKAKELAHEEITVPDNAPDWVIERYLSGSVAEASERLWNDTELRETRSTNHHRAQYSRSLTIALPIELSREQQIDLMRAFLTSTFASRGMIADWVIHEIEGNPHAHVMLTMRDILPDQWGKRNLSWNKVALYREFRFEWAAFANDALERAGFDVRIDHRTLAEQGIEIEPSSYNHWAAEHAEAAGEIAREKARNAEVRARNEAYLVANPEHILAIVSAQKSVFTKKDVSEAFQKRLSSIGKEAFEALMERVMAAPDLVEIGSDPANGMDIFATKAQVAMDARLIVDAVRLASSTLEVDPDPVTRVLADHLSAEQRAAAQAMLSSARLTIVRGTAGAGKTSTVGEVARIWQERGFTVLGGAVSGRAAQELQKATSGMEVASLAAWEARWSMGRTPEQGRFVFVMDEAGMVGSDLWVRIQAQVGRMGGKLIAVGDPEQVQPVSAGSALKAVEDQVGSAIIGVVRRQKDPLERAATMDLASGAEGAEQALRFYHRKGAIVFLGERDQATAGTGRDGRDGSAPGTGRTFAAIDPRHRIDPEAWDAFLKVLASGPMADVSTPAEQPGQTLPDAPLPDLVLSDAASPDAAMSVAAMPDAPSPEVASLDPALSERASLAGHRDLLVAALRPALSRARARTFAHRFEELAGSDALVKVSRILSGAEIGPPLPPSAIFPKTAARLAEPVLTAAFRELQTYVPAMGSDGEPGVVEPWDDALKLTRPDFAPDRARLDAARAAAVLIGPALAFRLVTRVAPAVIEEAAFLESLALAPPDIAAGRRGAAEQTSDRPASRTARAIADVYWTKGDPSDTRMAMAYLNTDVAELNREIRAKALAIRRLDAAGAIEFVRSGPAVKGVEETNISLAPGDRVRFVAPVRALSVNRSAFATVRAVSPDAVSLQIDGATDSVTLDATSGVPLDYGYAATVHKLQGMTVAHAFVKPSNLMTRHLHYVALSRHTQSVQMFVDDKRLSSIDALVSSAVRDGYMPLAVDPSKAAAVETHLSSAKLLSSDLSEASDITARRDHAPEIPPKLVTVLGDPHLRGIASRFAGLIAADAPVARPNQPEPPLLLDDPRGYADDPRRVVDDILERHAVLRAEDVATRLAGITVDPQTFLRLFDQAMSHAGLIALAEDAPDGRGRVYSTLDHVRAELQLSDLAARLALAEPARSADGTRLRALDPDRLVPIARDDRPTRKVPNLSEDQRAAYAHIFGPSRLSVITGIAGSGKSTLLTSVYIAAEAQGWRVVGTALAGKAVESLERASGIRARSLAGLEAEFALADETGTAVFDPRTILVIDEAGMIGTDQMTRVLTRAEAEGAKVIIVGDPYQLQPLEDGAPARVIADRVGAVELTSVWRQVDPGDRAATLGLWKGGAEAKAAIQHYLDKGAVTAIAGRTDLLEAAAQAWIADPAQEKIALAHSNADVRAFNARVAELRHDTIRDEVARLTRAAEQAQAAYEVAKAEALAKGNPLAWLRKPPRAPELPALPVTYTRGEAAAITLAAGDQIVFETNDRTLGVKNGTLARVVDVRQDRFIAQIGEGEERRLVEVDPATMPAFAHGFATTVHKAQGLSIASVHLVVTGGFDLTMAYVGLTRHKENLAIYASSSPARVQSWLSDIVSRSGLAPSTLDHGFDKGQAIAAAFATLPASDTPERTLSLPARRALDRFADRHVRSGQRRWDEPAASSRGRPNRDGLVANFLRDLDRPVDEYDYLWRKDSAKFWEGLRSGRARFVQSKATRQMSDRTTPLRDATLAVPANEARQSDALEARARLAAAWTEVTGATLDGPKRDALWSLAEAVTSQAGWREALRDVSFWQRSGLRKDGDALAAALAPEGQSPTPLSRALARAYLLAEATGRREEAALFKAALSNSDLLRPAPTRTLEPSMQTQIDVTPRDGLPPVADLAAHPPEFSEPQSAIAAQSDTVEQAVEPSPASIAPSWAERLERWSTTRAESVPLPERAPILEAAGLKGPVALAGTTIGQIGAEAAFGPKSSPALQDALRKLPDLLKAPEAIFANKGFRPDLWYVVTSAKDDAGKPVTIRLERANANNPEAGLIARLDRGPISGVTMDAKAKDVVLYARDPEALPALGFAKDDRVDPALIKAVEEKAAVIEQTPAVERADAAAPTQPSPDVVKRARLEVAARAEDQRLGITREPGEDILSRKAVDERHVARQALSKAKYKAKADQSIAQGPAKEQVRQIGGERPKDEDQLTPKAVTERDDDVILVEQETVTPADDKRLGIQREPGEDVQSEKAFDDRQAAHFDLMRKQGEAEIERIFEEVRAKALDRQLGIERPENEDPLSPKAVKEREAVSRRLEREAAAHAEDQRLGITREPGEDILSEKAFDDRQAAHLDLMRKQGAAEIERIFEEVRAKALDRQLGIERPENEDPLSPKAVMERADAEHRIHLEKVKGAMEEDRKLGIVRAPGEDVLSAKAVAERAQRHTELRIDEFRAALKLPPKFAGQEKDKAVEQTKAKDKDRGGMGMDW